MNFKTYRKTISKLYKSSMNPLVDEFLNKAKKWQAEMTSLRRIILECGLTEEFKWSQPCYTFEERNVVIIGELKECCVISFFKGALLKDDWKILARPGENTQAARIIRFTNVAEIEEIESTLKAYIIEAIELERSGLKVEITDKNVIKLPEELILKFEAIPDLKTAFHTLTPGRQRAYLLYFSQPKQSKTRESRIDKYIPRIFEGKGIHDW